MFSLRSRSHVFYAAKLYADWSAGYSVVTDSFSAVLLGGTSLVVVPKSINWLISQNLDLTESRTNRYALALDWGIV